MNRIVNEYGAMRYDGVAEVARLAHEEYQARMRQIIETYQLTPEEVRCLDSCLKPSVFAEEVLRKAFKMKQEKKV